MPMDSIDWEVALDGFRSGWRPDGTTKRRSEQVNAMLRRLRSRKDLTWEDWFIIGWLTYRYQKEVLDGEKADRDEGSSEATGVGGTGRGDTGVADHRDAGRDEEGA